MLNNTISLSSIDNATVSYKDLNGIEKSSIGQIFTVSTPNPSFIDVKEEEESESEKEEQNTTCERSSLVKYEKQRNIYSFEQRYNLIKLVNVDGFTIRKAASITGIKLASAKNIISLYSKQKRIQRKNTPKNKSLEMREKELLKIVNYTKLRKKEEELKKLTMEDNCEIPSNTPSFPPLMMPQYQMMNPYYQQVNPYFQNFMNNQIFHYNRQMMNHPKLE